MWLSKMSVLVGGDPRLARFTNSQMPGDRPRSVRRHDGPAIPALSRIEFDNVTAGSRRPGSWLLLPPPDTFRSDKTAQSRKDAANKKNGNHNIRKTDDGSAPAAMHSIPSLVILAKQE